ncbi:shikimate dehydrogenase [Deinococcus fonticola]|uniref:shikimate dehydrogenase n=1 Tax=Deinococcus fonticola TaxID=2528713 RepID=UPI0010751B67|nr:shikimate dehydrogenase [Deinococcus fonticola]
MLIPADAPLALIGYSSRAARALSALGLITLPVPDGLPADLIGACQTLKFSGALVAPAQGHAWLGAVTADTDARRAGRVDAVSFHGAAGAQGTFAYAEALSDAVRASGYAVVGASLLIIGHGVSDMVLAAPIARLGFTDIGLAADSAPEAERVRRELPSVPRLFPVSRRDSSVKALADRSDLVVLTGGELPRGLLQPYHTLLDLTGREKPSADGATLLDLYDLPAHHLARQLQHATGKSYRPEELSQVSAALS